MRTDIAKKLAADIEVMKKEAEANSRIADFEQAADDMYNLYLAFCRVGFTEAQAWEIIKITIAKEVK